MWLRYRIAPASCVVFHILVLVCQPAIPVGTHTTSVDGGDDEPVVQMAWKCTRHTIMQSEGVLPDRPPQPLVHAPAAQSVSSEVTPTKLLSRPNTALSRPNTADEPQPRPSIQQSIGELRELSVNAGFDIEICTTGQDFTRDSESEPEAEGQDEADEKVSRFVPATILRVPTGFKVLCRGNTSLREDVDLSNMGSLISRLQSGSIRPARPLAPHEVSLLVSSATERKRRERRPPSEIKAEWDALNASGIVRPMGPADNPIVYPESSQKDLFCNPCGEVVKGTGALHNWCARLSHSAQLRA